MYRKQLTFAAVIASLTGIRTYSMDPGYRESLAFDKKPLTRYEQEIERIEIARQQYQVKSKKFHSNQEKLNRYCPFFNDHYQGNEQWIYAYNLLQPYCQYLRDKNNELHKEWIASLTEKKNAENHFHEWLPKDPFSGE